jgi:transcriptional regulator with XRE-family HTH domain
MIGKELKAIRRRLGWSQQQLADAAGVWRNSIARQERGEMGIKESLARLLRLIAIGTGGESSHGQASRRAASSKKTNRGEARHSVRKNRQRQRR